MQELLVSSDGKVGILQNVKFMTLFANSFFFFSSEREENCEKENNVCHDLGFCSSESSYISRIGIPLMEYFLLFSKTTL